MMAGGNWSERIFAFEDGELRMLTTSRCGVSFGRSVGGLGVYKNWIEVVASDGPTLRLWSGTASMDQLWIHAERGPREGVYFVTWNEQPDGKLLLLCGLGIYGFADRSARWRGIRAEELIYLARIMDPGRIELRHDHACSINVPSEILALGYALRKAALTWGPTKEGT